VEFVYGSIRDGYQEFFVEHSGEIFAMLDDAFERLVESQSSGVDERKLLGTAQYLASSVFKKKIPPFGTTKFIWIINSTFNPKMTWGNLRNLFQEKPYWILGAAADI